MAAVVRSSTMLVVTVMADTSSSGALAVMLAINMAADSTSNSICWYREYDQGNYNNYT